MKNNSRKRNQKLVHLTHHMCLVDDGRNGDGIVERLYENKDGFRRYRYSAAYSEYARDPSLWGHNRCRYGSRTSLLTTDLDAVTCSTCLAWVADESLERLFAKASARGISDGDKRYYERRAEAWCDDEELKMRAWLLCCRHVGAPCPRPRREAIRRLRAARADLVLAGVQSATFTWPLRVNTVEQLTEVLGKIDPADRELLPGVIERAKKADALMKRAGEIMESIEAIARQAAKRIAKTAEIELPARVA